MACQKQFGYVRTSKRHGKNQGGFTIPGFCVDIGPLGNEHDRSILIDGTGGTVQGCETPVILGAHVGPVGEQGLNHILVAESGGDVHRRLAENVPRVGVCPVIQE